MSQLNNTGKLSVNGRDYTYDQISEYLNNSDISSEERAALAGTLSAIQKGNARSLDVNANSLSGTGVETDFNSFYGNDWKAKYNMSNRGSRARSKWQAFWNTDHHVVNTAISKLGGIDKYFTDKNNRLVQEAKAKADEDKEKNILHKLEGDVFKDGKYVRGIYDTTHQGRYESILNYLKNKDLRNTYNLSEWDDDETLNGLTAWYDNLDDNAKKQYETKSFWGRVMGDNLMSDYDRSLLTTIGLNPGEKSEVVPAPIYNLNGNDSDNQSRGISFKQDADGRWSINDDGTYSKNNWMGYGLDFLKGTDYENGVIWNGKLYTWDEVESGKFDELNNTFQPIMNASAKRGFNKWYDAANNSGIRFVGDRIYAGKQDDGDYYAGYIKYDPTTHYSDIFKNQSHPYKDTPTYFKDVTPYYDVTNNPNARVIAYMSNEEDIYGRPKVKYRYINENGEYTDYNDDSINDVLQKVKTKGFNPEINDVKLYELFGLTGAQSKRWYDTGKQYGGHTIVKDIYGNYGIRTDADGKVGVKLLRNQYKNTFNNYLNGIHKFKTINEFTDMFFDKVSYQKYGGTIKPLPQKFFNGGVAGSAKNNTVINKVGEPTEVDVTQTHKINKDKNLFKSISEDFSDAEQLQLGAALTDLVGVGLSFIPGAHIASAATGLGATTAQFIADVKKDGFQGKDVTMALLSGAMDVGTLFTGSVAKVPKVIKAVRAAAKPIMKLLTLAGAANGAAAMGKVIRGEDITSEDLISILRGITSTSIGAKMVKSQIGDAKLSKKLEETVLNKNNANLASKPKAEIGGKQIELEDDVVKSITGKNKTEVEDILKTKVKAKLESEGVTFDESKHGKGLAEKFGIEFNKGKFHWKKDGKWRDPKTAKEWKATEPKEASSTVSHFLNPFKRNKYLGFDYGFWSSNGKLGDVDSDMYNIARNIVLNHDGKWYDRWSAQSLMDKAALNPNAFNLNFEGNGYVYPGRVFGWRGIDKNGQPINIFGNSKWYHWPFNKIQYARDLSTDAIQQPQIPTQSLLLPASSKGAIRVMRAYDRHNMSVPTEMWETLRLSGLKNGGKIQFAKCGKKIRKHTFGQSIGKIGKIGNIAAIGAQTLLSGAKAASAWGASKKQGDLIKQLKPHQDQLLPAPSFHQSDPGIGRTYDKAIDKYQMYTDTFKSADQNANIAVGLTNVDKQADLILDKGLTIAKHHDAESAQHKDLINKYQLSNNQIINSNNLRGNQNKAAKLQYESAKIAQDQAIGDGLMNDISGITKKAFAAKTALDKYNLQKRYTDSMNTWRDEFDKSAIDGKINGKSFNDWLKETHGEAYDKLVQDAIGLQFQKRGGRFRPVQEQLAIDNQKLKQKAISQLSKQAFDLLKKALS